MSEESNGFYPELPQKAQEQAIELIEKFKTQLQETANKAVGDMYCDILPHIQTDAWQNFRTSILNEVCNYRNSITAPSYYRRIREAIYAEHKEAIDKDLNQDLLKQVEQLKLDVQRAYENR